MSSTKKNIDDFSKRKNFSPQSPIKWISQKINKKEINKGTLEFHNVIEMLDLFFFYFQHSTTFCKGFV